jgi:hypothetical protein
VAPHAGSAFELIALPPASATMSSPMPIAQRQVFPTDAGSAAPDTSSVPNVSFASMFADSGAEAREQGFTSVQLHSAGPESEHRLSDGPTVQREEAEVPSPPLPTASTVAAGPEGTAPAVADLDEMARRLFEPLSARLRAELWLDRERAGLVSDVRA